MKRVLLLSAYHAASHTRWSRGLIDYFSDWEWTLESLPARYFNWRSRGNSLTWGLGDFPHLDRDYDLIVATSMVDLATLRGLRPSLAKIPAIVYFHENQFAYPSNYQQQGLLEIQLTSIYTALAADRVLFNSTYNLNTFLQGADALLARMPDAVPKNIVNRLQERAYVLPVPLEVELNSARPVARSQSRPIELLWNHRWEWDKGPDRLLALAEQLALQGYLGSGFKFHVVGEQFRQVPEHFKALKALLEEYGALGRWGYGESLTDYRDLITRCHAVVSTAIHDFQGLAVLEAAILGCIPFVPNRLAYPEWFERFNCYPSFIDQPEVEAAEAAATLIRWFYPKGITGPINSSAPTTKNAVFRHMSWQELGPTYRQYLS